MKSRIDVVAAGVIIVALLGGGMAWAQTGGPVAAFNNSASGESRGAAPGDPLRKALSGLGPGPLYDRVLPLAGVPELDGSDSAPLVPIDRWRQALFELRLASLPAPPASWPTPSQIREAAAVLRGDDAIPLAVLDVSYSRLRPDAIARGALFIEGDRVAVSPGATTGDYLTETQAFAATALASWSYQGTRVSFVLPRDLYVTGGTLPTRVDVDFDDGRGLRALAFDTPVTVCYASTGPRTVRLRASREDGRVLWSRFPFQVRALRALAPSATWPLTADIPYQGTAASGEAYVYLADGHASLEDPVVVIEGFDLDDSMGWEVLYDLLNQENLLEDLRTQGRDAVILNFTSATDPIQRNAYLAVKLLQTVQAAIAPGRTFPLVGASMGGLVGRYALCYMEQEVLPHAVNTFVSFDAPQLGADIPLGLQYWLDFFQGESEEAAHLLSRLDTPAARQMLLYHHTSPPSSAGVADPQRDALLADFAALGDYPAQPRLVAVANGSGYAANQGFAAGEQVVRWEYASFLVDITGNIWAVPDGSGQLIFDGEIDLIWPLQDSFMSVTVSGTQPWDSAPGGSRASMAEMDAVPAPYGDIVALHPAHAFIPTVSSLALAVDDPFHDIAGDPGLLSLTPFAAVYFPVENQEHILITPENKTWFLAELAGPSPTVAAELTCEPPVGTLPFSVTMTARLDNLHAQQVRRVAGRVDIGLAGGQHYSNWRSGWTNIDAGGSYATSWNQALPALGSLVGPNVFQLLTADVTPAPYNQPPYPPAGGTDSDSCTVTGFAP
jgi:hypothetical protein